MMFRRSLISIGLALGLAMLPGSPATAAKHCPSLCRAERRACRVACVVNHPFGPQRHSCKNECRRILSRCRAAQDVPTCLPPS